MVIRPFKLLHKIITATPVGIIFIIFCGGWPSAAAPVTFEGSEGGAALYLGVFILLSLCLIAWMLWDRKKVKRKLMAVEQENYLQALLLKSRRVVSLQWDEAGEISSFEAVREWLEIDNDAHDMACFRGQGGAFSDAQFDDLMGCVDRLRTEGEKFRKLFFLAAQKRNIVVRGEPLYELSGIGGVVVWFRDATVEENIAVFQGKDVRKINKQLKFFETTSNLVQFPMWVRDETLKLIWVNKAYVEAVDGENVERVISEGLELVTSSIGRTTRDIAAISVESNAACNEKHFVVIQGERRAVDINNIPVRIDKDRMGSMGYAQDITELEKARGELIHHTESHSETLNKLSTAVAIFTSGQRLEYYNSAFSRLWHLPESLLFSHPHHGEVLEAMREARRLPEQANFPEWKAGQLDAYTRLLEPVEEMWHLPDNTSLRVVSQPHPLGGLLIFYEDVTDHFALERSYNTLFAVQRETLNNLHEGLAVFGIDGCLQLYNKAFAGIWNLDRDMLDANPHTGDVMDACARNFGKSDEISALKNLIVGGEVKRALSSGH
ncbi:MAG: PAS-domain containing protein [Emcibacter sp.]|nr:PAS-domain containing protein [Emcibacter sp.]